jgi:hypothetical protein
VRSSVSCCKKYAQTYFTISWKLPIRFKHVGTNIRMLNLYILFHISHKVGDLCSMFMAVLNLAFYHNVSKFLCQNRQVISDGTGINCCILPSFYLWTVCALFARNVSAQKKKLAKTRRANIASMAKNSLSHVHVNVLNTNIHSNPLQPLQSKYMNPIKTKNKAIDRSI